MMDKAISARALRFRYQRGKNLALDGIDWEQGRGEAVALVGRSGAGKSSFLLCLNRIIPNFYPGDFSGELEIFAERLSGKRTYELAKKIGLVLQDFESQLFSTRAELDMAFGPENLGVSREEISRRIDESLAAVGMSAFRNRSPESLSGGEKQRLDIASALALAPEILLFDEACTDLDPLGREQVRAVVRSLKAQGKTIILVDHEPEGLAPADRIVILSRGKIAAEASRGQMLYDHSLLQSNGIRPPEMAELFSALKLSPIELDPLKAAVLCRQKGFAPAREAVSQIEKSDEEREQNRGKVLIQVSGLEHSYPGGIQALSGIDLEVREGDFLAIIGQNGSGKTTLVKHLNGLLGATRGAVIFQGKEIVPSMLSKLGRQIGFVFQNPDHQIFSSRVADEVAFGPRNYGFTAADTKNRIKEALDLVGLAGRDNENPFLLTKGERQRLAIASVISPDPQVLILDEPSTGLDYNEQLKVMDMLAELNRRGRTIIIITHTLWLLARYAKRAAVMAGGRKILEGSVRQVLSRPEILKQASLIPPEITRFGLEMGFPFLTMEEAARALGAGR